MQDRTDTPASAFWRAAYNGDTELVIRLHAEGVDLNVWDKWGRTALTFAAGAGHLDTVKCLVQFGAWVDPHEDYDVYLTPLMEAAKREHTGIVEFLLIQGADPTRHGGVTQATARFYLYGKNPALADLLLKAEDQWRETHR